MRLKGLSGDLTPCSNLSDFNDAKVTETSLYIILVMEEESQTDTNSVKAPCTRLNRQVLLLDSVRTSR